jgi:hypothetical protein
MLNAVFEISLFKLWELIKYCLFLFVIFYRWTFIQYVHQGQDGPAKPAINPLGIAVDQIGVQDLL